MPAEMPPSDRRTFLKVASTLAAGAAAGCTVETRIPDASPSGGTERQTGFDRLVLDALGEVMLPSELGPRRRDVAIGDFVQWIDGYTPVAEEMHGYGYADVRYLPPDPAPNWRAQLDALDQLARKIHGQPFARIALAQRQQLLDAALRGYAASPLPAPLHAPHIALALLSHWAASPAAWDLALGKQVQAGTCRPLADGVREPLPVPGVPS
jgi:hypothetical protein